MGWADCGTDSRGRPIGYAFEATCDEPGCEAEIDRGLSFACGGMHGEGDGCEGYFCWDHLFFHGYEDPDGPVCARCLGDLDAAVAEDAETFADGATKAKRETDAYRFAVALTRVWHALHPREAGATTKEADRA